MHIGLDHVIAIGLILSVWVFNFFGTRVAVTFNYLAGVLLMFPLFCFTLLPFINGDFTTDNLTYKLNDGLALGRLADGPGLDLDHDLVDRARGGRDVRAGVQGHRLVTRGRR